MIAESDRIQDLDRIGEERSHSVRYERFEIRGRKPLTVRLVLGIVRIDPGDEAAGDILIGT